MSVKKKRFQQVFSRTEKPYVLDVVSEVPVLGEEVDLQELRNSCYDDTFFSRLEAIFGGLYPTVNVSDEVSNGELELTGSRLDKIQRSVDDLSVLRKRYGVSDDLSIHDAIAVLKSKEIYRKEDTPNENQKNEAQTSGQTDV